MKRLLIASFLIICSVSILALTHQPVKKQSACKQKICCTKKCNKAEQLNPKTDYIFWEPMGRLLMIPQ